MNPSSLSFTPLHQGDAEPAVQVLQQRRDERRAVPAESAGRERGGGESLPRKASRCVRTGIRVPGGGGRGGDRRGNAAAVEEAKTEASEVETAPGEGEISEQQSEGAEGVVGATVETTAAKVAALGIQTRAEHSATTKGAKAGRAEPRPRGTELAASLPRGGNPRGGNILLYRGKNY